MTDDTTTRTLQMEYRPRRAKRRIPAWLIYMMGALLGGFISAVIANYLILPVQFAFDSLLLAFVAAFAVGLTVCTVLAVLAMWAVRRWSQ